MSKKSFFLGILTGVVFSIACLVVIGVGLVNCNSAFNDSIQYLEKPVNYENKKETSVKVFQVLGNAALACEASGGYSGEVFYNGTVVLILGEDFYNDQIIRIKKPQRVGTYSYTSNAGMQRTVPVVVGDIE